jgi:hypothetical protein
MHLQNYGMFMHKDVIHNLEKVQSKLADHDNQFMIIFEYLKQIEKAKQEDLEYKGRRKIGYKRTDEE